MTVRAHRDTILISRDEVNNETIGRFQALSKLIGPEIIWHRRSCRLVLTSFPLLAINVDDMEIDSMPSRLFPLRIGYFLYSNRQDAREGGEIPPLPRNCERTCQMARRIGQGRELARALPPFAEDP